MSVACCGIASFLTFCLAAHGTPPFACGMPLKIGWENCSYCPVPPKNLGVLVVEAYLGAEQKRQVWSSLIRSTLCLCVIRCSHDVYVVDLQHVLFLDTYCYQPLWLWYEMHPATQKTWTSKCLIPMFHCGTAGVCIPPMSTMQTSTATWMDFWWFLAFCVGCTTFLILCEYVYIYIFILYAVISCIIQIFISWLLPQNVQTSTNVLWTRHCHAPGATLLPGQMLSRRAAFYACGQGDHVHNQCKDLAIKINQVYSSITCSMDSLQIFLINQALGKGPGQHSTPRVLMVSPPCERQVSLDVRWCDDTKCNINVHDAKKKKNIVYIVHTVIYLL